MAYLVALLAIFTALVAAQEQCYFGPGAENRATSDVVPCEDSGQSACCLLGDTCLSGNACYNYESGNTYQYGCTDINYEDETCPYKCGFNSSLSPWTALTYCDDVDGVDETWACHAPESCGCDWEYDAWMFSLDPIGCKDMGSEAQVALWAPSKIAPFVSLPATHGGSTGYYSPTTISGTSSWVSTAVKDYTPSPIAPLTTYPAVPKEAVAVDPDAEPPSSIVSSSAPGPTTETETETITPSSEPSASTSSSSTTSNLESSTASSSLSASSSGTDSAAIPVQTSSSSGLSTGGKAGIGVGVGIGVCLIIALAFALYLLRKKRKAPQSQQPEHIEQGSPMLGAPYYANEKSTGWRGSHGPDIQSVSPYQYPTELDAGLEQKPSRHEMPSPPMELPVEDRAQELGFEPSRITPGTAETKSLTDAKS